MIDGFTLKYKGQVITSSDLVGIYNNQGTLVAKTFDIGHLPSGVYVVVAQDNETKKPITTKIIKK